ncbi:MAG TPA: family 1 encapsulin nanocompartment shell protein [Anaerolineae bacterium]|nr:family 1 encapsulin nanocompartment shell protein [Anaerolineae bacterium]
MASEFLSREEAPFGGEVWQKIDDTVVGAASSQLAGRRILEIEGPYGFGIKAIPGMDRPVGESVSMREVKAELISSPMIPLASVQSSFAIPIRDVASFEQTGIEFDISEAASAAIAAARQEDTLIFLGSRALGVEGLASLKAAGSYKLGSWDEVGKSIDDIIAAIGVLDKAGFPGPYAMALAPNRYNLLFRRYMQGNLSEFDLLKEVISGGIVKAPVLKDGGVIVASGRQFATIALGQDLVATFVGPVDGTYEFLLVGSLTLRVKVPEAICVLKT